MAIRHKPDVVVSSSHLYFRALQLNHFTSLVEVNVGIMCACLPSLKALVTRIVPKFSLKSDEHGQHEISLSKFDSPLPDLNNVLPGIQAESGSDGGRV